MTPDHIFEHTVGKMHRGRDVQLNQIQLHVEVGFAERTCYAQPGIQCQRVYRAAERLYPLVYLFNTRLTKRC
jgi:hypothetical protein